MEKISKTVDEIADAMESSTTPVLLLSGGKDSVTLMNLCRPWRGSVRLVWARTTAELPHMVEFVRRVAEGWQLDELVSDQDECFSRSGLPTKLPIYHSELAGVRLQSDANCCNELIAQPVRAHLRSVGADLVMHGQTREDTELRGIRPAHEFFGNDFRLLAPLAAWRREEVLSYCVTQGIELPVQYLSGVIDSIGCWNCTAKGLRVDRVRWICDNYPNLGAQLSIWMHRAYDLAVSMVDQDVKPILAAMDQHMHGTYKANLEAAHDAYQAGYAAAPADFLQEG